MTNAFTVSGLTKTYPDFVLDQVSFSVPSGPLVASSRISSLEWWERATEIASFIFIPTQPWA